MSFGFTSNGVKMLQVPKAFCAKIVSDSKGLLKQINCNTKTRGHVFEANVSATSMIRLLMLKIIKANKENGREGSYKASNRTSLRTKIQ